MATKIKVKKTHEHAIIPKYEHKGDSGMDVFSMETLLIPPMRRTLVNTGLAFEVPKGYEIQVRPKSGLALKEGITVLNTPGTIDSNYRGELGIVLINHSSKPYLVEKGKKIAQIVLQRVETIAFKEVKELKGTTRGAGGFGSTGLDKK